MQGTIIVVDDNKGVLSAVKLLLKNSFERIITLTSPITLPAVLREENAQVVLLDMNFSSGLNTGNEGALLVARNEKKCNRHYPSCYLLLTLISIWLYVV